MIPKTLKNVVDQHLAARGHHPAVETLDREVSYLELSRLIQVMAGNLHQHGIALGSPVAVLLPNSIEHLTLLCALANRGAIIIPIHQHLPLYSQQQLLAGVDVQAVITSRGNSRLLTERQIDIGELAIDTKGPVEPSQVDGHSPLIMIQSSGTTGVPKRCFASQGQMVDRIRENAHYQNFRQDDRCLQAPLLSFVFGVNRAFMTLDAGATLVLHQSKSRPEFMDFIVQQRISTTFLTPQQLSALAAGPHQQPQLPNLKLITTTAHLSSAQRQHCLLALTPHLYEYYATNEVGAISILNPMEATSFPSSVGRIVAAVELQIVDDQDRVVANGHVGHVRIRKNLADAPSVYFDNPMDSAKAFRAGWFYPGDLARMNFEGYLFLIGRSDDVINNNGAKFYPIEVEDVLHQHPAVVEASVVSVNDAKNGALVVAFIVIREARDSFVEQTLISFCRERIGFKSPRHIVCVDELPRNPAGKILKRELRAMCRSITPVE